MQMQHSTWGFITEDRTATLLHLAVQAGRGRRVARGCPDLALSLKPYYVVVGNRHTFCIMLRPLQRLARAMPACSTCSVELSPELYPFSTQHATQHSAHQGVAK